MATRKTVKLGGRTLRVATKLSAGTNARRGYCPACSGLGTRRTGRGAKARPCSRCNGTGRATTPNIPKTTATAKGKTGSKTTTTGTPHRTRPSADIVASRRTGVPAVGRNAGPRTAYGAAAASRTAQKRSKKASKKTPTALRLFGIGGRRLPVNKALRGWARGVFGTRTTTAGQARAQANRSFGQTIAVGGNLGSSWWRCPRCSATETGLRDGDTATGRAAAHWASTHPGAPFRLDPATTKG